MSSAELSDAVSPREPDHSRRRAEEMMAAPPEQDGPVNVSEKLVVRARVVLSAVAPRE